MKGSPAIVLLAAGALLLPQPGRCGSSDGLLPGWGETDIGSPAISGAASYTNGTWSLSGGGTGIGGATDQFSFCSNSLSGDGAILVRVMSQTGADTQAVAGIMIRDNESPGASQASVYWSQGSNVFFRCRPSADAATLESSVPGIAAPVWLRLSRSGGVFTASYSVNGLSWTQIGSPQTATLGPAALAGFVVSSHNDSLTNTARQQPFDRCRPAGRRAFQLDQSLYRSDSLCGRNHLAASAN